MKLNYVKYQNKSKNEKMNGKWYGRVAIRETVEIEEIANRMQDNCTVKRADILAVLSELGTTMRDLLQDSKRVVIPYLGAFKLSISTEGAQNAEEFTAKNVTGVRVLFQPTTRQLADGRRVKDLTDGCRLVELREYMVGDENAEGDNDGGNGNDGGNDGPVVEQPEG